MSRIYAFSGLLAFGLINVQLLVLDDDLEQSCSEDVIEVVYISVIETFDLLDFAWIVKNESAKVLRLLGARIFSS